MRGRPVVFGVVERDVEILHARLLERRVDIGAAEDVPERQRRAVVRDRDHRLERLVQGQLRPGVLERSVGRDVFRLDRDRVVVVELAGVDPALGLRQHTELVERRRDHLLLRVVSEERRGDGGVGDPDPSTARERADQTVELLGEVRGARRRWGRHRQGDDKVDGGDKSDLAHPPQVTAARSGCFTV